MNEIELKFWDALNTLIDEEYEFKWRHEEILRADVRIKTECRQDRDIETCFMMYYQTYFHDGKDIPTKHKNAAFVNIYPQQKTGPYILDFLVVVDGFSHSVRQSYGIEIDGHEWHEKTKDQASRDKKRERILFASAIPSIRFTGSDVYANPIECARDAIETGFSSHINTILNIDGNRNELFL